MCKEGEVFRGEIYWCGLGDESVGSEQRGTRPVLVLQNNVANHFSTTIIVAIITSKLSKRDIPTHVKILANNKGLKKDSVILLEQIKTVDKARLGDYITCLGENDMLRVEKAMSISVAMNNDSVAIKKCILINELTTFIHKWLDKGMNINLITNEVQELRNIIYEFQIYCKVNKLNHEYYLNEYCSNIKNDLQIAVAI